MNFKPIYQTGVALITALLITALATIVAVSMLGQQHLAIRRSTNFIHHDQALQYAFGGETWAMRILIRDLSLNKIDGLQDIWAMRLSAIPIEGGSMIGQIEDLQGRFNLNNLLKDGKVSPEDVQQFQRLLLALQMPVNLSQVVIDWMDADAEISLPEGAEDNAYLLKTPSYRAANQALRSPTELRLLAGMTPEFYQRLLPHVCTLPTRTQINLNTATIPVIMSLAEGLSEAAATQLIAGRDQKAFETLQAVLANPVLAGLKMVDSQSLSLSSNYFLYSSRVQLDRGQTLMSSVLERITDKVRVVSRIQDGVSFETRDK
ncbi:MAG: type II secretion system minor pseudopilin GspK [Thiotrichaceae bacterium]|nr:type II secretion system minor pseudopilin GspK [Thiotrichaceae bacterium]